MNKVNINLLSITSKLIPLKNNIREFRFCQNDGHEMTPAMSFISGCIL